MTTGHAADPCVRAAATLTLALPKTGLPGSPETGKLFLADISVPPALYRKMAIEAGDLFAENTIMRLHTSG